MSPSLEPLPQARRFKAAFVLFDLDGTLVDTAPDLAYCVDGMLTSLGMPACGEERVRLWIGNGAARLVKRALTGDLHGEPEPELFERAFSRFNSLYHQHTARASQPYPGVVETLEWLVAARLRVGCVTNKPRVFSTKLLDALQLSGRLDTLICGDDVSHKKPHPLPLIQAAQNLGFAPELGVMVGDSKSDVRAARAAGMPVICVSFGYNHGESVTIYEPDAVIGAFDELPGMLQFHPDNAHVSERS